MTDYISETKILLTRSAENWRDALNEKYLKNNEKLERFVFINFFPSNVLFLASRMTYLQEVNFIKFFQFAQKHFLCINKIKYCRKEANDKFINMLPKCWVGFAEVVYVLYLLSYSRYGIICLLNKCLPSNSPTLWMYIVCQLEVMTEKKIDQTTRHLIS